MAFWERRTYVSAAERRRKAQRAVQRASTAGKAFEPVLITTRAIANTFWGKAWCENLERWSDFENRLPRGRAYVRNGSVIDLKVAAGRVDAEVMGSSRYQVRIEIDPVSKPRWTTLARDCTGSVASLIDLLQGQLSDAVMARICAPDTGLFPAPRQIRFDCSCPDWAVMCKHVAAVLYGVGARLDDRPELLFVLRQVDAGDLLAASAKGLAPRIPASGGRRVLEDSALGDIFGIDMTSDHSPPARAPAAGAARRRPASRTVVKALAAPPTGKSAVRSTPRRPSTAPERVAGRAATRETTESVATKSQATESLRKSADGKTRGTEKAARKASVKKLPAKKAPAKTAAANKNAGKKKQHAQKKVANRSAARNASRKRPDGDPRR